LYDTGKGLAEVRYKFTSAHAPIDADEKVVKEQFWDLLSDTQTKCGANRKTYTGIDANARVGSISSHSFSDEWPEEETDNGTSGSALRHTSSSRILP